LPRAAGIFLAFKPSATARSEAAPLACSSAMTGAMSAAGFPEGLLHLGAWCDSTIAELDNAPLRCGEGLLGAIGDHASLQISDGNHLLQYEPAGGAPSICAKST